ncbi:vesicle transport protein SEC20 [Melitaea cinxia]|uniref:vesicle transport protein SEC20 n=1 Tax=Melitaea cinxia TaxID=113334 RepID=UPI001E26F25E|nr:vesicle transport protein SEC20 [Melitaea cinxia]
MIYTMNVNMNNKIPKVEEPDVTYQNFIQNLATYHFQVKAIIQDILDCRDSMEVLNHLNDKGRAKLSLLREELENLDSYATDMGDQKYFLEVASQRHLLAGLLKEFKEANISSMFAIEKAQREDLLKTGDVEESMFRNRIKKINRDGLLKMSTGATERLLSISRQLAATTQRSQDTLDSLVSSSSTVHGTQAELQNTGSTITQSSKLLKKYGRREFTDKVIMFFAFLFFLAVCLYIVQKRLF